MVVPRVAAQDESMNARQAWFAEMLQAERPRLVRLCAALSRDPDAAEDLAQETLIEAWRHRHKLTEPAGISPWLSAIARNVCLRWRRYRRHDHARLAVPPDANGPAPGIPDDIADAFDLEVELERD